MNHFYYKKEKSWFCCVHNISTKSSGLSGYEQVIIQYLIVKNQFASVQL